MITIIKINLIMPTIANHLSKKKMSMKLTSNLLSKLSISTYNVIIEEENMPPKYYQDDIFLNRK